MRVRGSILPMASSRSTLRLREKYTLLLTVACFVAFCMGGFFFLPELKAGTQFAYRQIKDAGPDLMGLIPPVDSGPTPQPGQQLEAPNPYFAPRGKISDMKILAEKIRSELSAINQSQNGAVVPPPHDFDSNGEVKSGPLGGEENSGAKHEVHEYTSDDWKTLDLGAGEDKDPEAQTRRETVKNMMKHAWTNYVQYAWGENELKPISMRGHSPGIFGNTKLGASIVDAMDTLFIMGMKEEFNTGRDWIENSLSIDNIHTDISVFEFNIRFVGGLLTCYAFTKDKMFLDKAEEIATRMLPAFNTPKEIPNALINPKTGFSKNYAWASSGCSILSEIGTLHLEFVYLSAMVKNPIFNEKAFKIRALLSSATKPNGLYPNYISPKTGNWGQHHISMGALGDSFYEYLLKAWVQSGGKDLEARKMYDDAMEAVEKHLLQTSAKGKLMYLADMKYDRLEHKMDHLACFSGGLIALGAQSMEKEAKQHYTNIGAGITNTCHESYVRTATGIGPESFRFSDTIEAKAMRQSEKYYILRPEVVESYFYLWRLTKDQKYRDWAWEAVQALEKHCRVANGYSGLKNVYDADGPKDDVQQSFLFAETLKYLYLIFSDDSLISFDEWVFNTEAHPLPILGRNPAYPRSNAQ